MNSTVLGGWSATPDQWLTSAEVQRTRDTVVLAHFDLAPAWNRLPACHHYNLLLTLVFSICLYSSPLLHYSAMFKRFFFFFFFFHSPQRYCCFLYLRVTHSETASAVCRPFFRCRKSARDPETTKNISKHFLRSSLTSRHHDISWKVREKETKKINERVGTVIRANTGNERKDTGGWKRNEKTRSRSFSLRSCKAGM